MSEEQQRREAIKYGDVFNVSGELGRKAITPRDAGMMQARENQVVGETHRGGPAAVMQSAASLNVREGLVNVDDSDIDSSSVSVRETKVGPNRVITEAVGNQVLAEFVKPDVPMRAPGGALDSEAITIGEALEASALTQAGDKTVDQSDAAAIQAAEMRATGRSEITPGGVGATAQSAATRTSQHRTTLSDVLTDARQQLPADKKVTREDADGVIGAELRNKADMKTTPGGVAASLAAAAILNHNK